MHSQQTNGDNWVRATWITAFLEAAFLVILLVMYALFKVGNVDSGFVVWALIFGGLGLGVFRGNRRSAWWLVGVQGFWVARLTLSVLTDFVSPYVLIFYIGALVVFIMGARHLRPALKEKTKEEV